MPRKRKSDQPINEADTTTTVATIEPPVETSADPLPAEQPPTFVERVSEKTTRKFRPDPYTIALDNAAGVRLFENRQDRVMAIAFDERPAQPVIDRIKEEGYRWNPTDRVWTHTVQRDTAMGTRIDAERLYQEVRQMIRKDKDIDSRQDIPF